jgi:hypothetical protein
MLLIGTDLRLATTIDLKLFTTLQSYSSPGGPLYPPRSVRQVARRVWMPPLLLCL